MKRLPDNFRNVLDKVDGILINLDYDNYDNINRSYKKINKLFIDGNCEVCDINNMLSKYEANTEYTGIVTKLKKMTTKRNKHIIKKIYRSEKWIPFLNKTKKDLYNDFNIDANTIDIKDGIVNVMKKYKNDWLGFWSLVDMYSNGEIKDIKLLDRSDYNSLAIYLNNKK